MKTLEVKKKEAEVRNSAHGKLTAAQKLLKLDIMFGEGKGAAKERAKLAIDIKVEANNNATAEKIEAKKADKKPYQKPKRS
jgi:hypothetical protein